MKKLYSNLCLSIALSLPLGEKLSAQTPLAQGDLSVIGFNTAPAERGIVFVLWKDVSAGTVIKFSNNGFHNPTTSTNNSNIRWLEQEIAWIATSTVTAGTVVRTREQPASASSGALTISNADGTNTSALDLSPAGDQVFAYVSSNMPVAAEYATFTGTLLFGLSYQGTGTAGNWPTPIGATANVSHLPSDLQANNHLYLAGNAGSGQYTGPRNTEGNYAAYRQKIADPANWTLSTSATAINMTNFTLATLPVSLAVPLTARATSSGIQLSWTTARESNNRAFVLYRSANGKDLTALGTLAGKGSSAAPVAYSYLDQHPLAGTNYYHLVQQDLNGKETQLGEQALTFSIDNGTLTVYPNPTAGRIDFSFPSGRFRQLQLSSLEGRTIHRRTISPVESQGSLTLSDLPKGTYLLQLSGGSEQLVRKIVRH